MIWLTVSTFSPYAAGKNVLRRELVDQRDNQKLKPSHKAADMAACMNADDKSA